ncbi:MAG: hypothetical protein L0H36_01790 [bacterium]|nr:hypothetical protein [bacterium]MDN5835345.1 hypothetical protein [bacterium]
MSQASKDKTIQQKSDNLSELIDWFDSDGFTLEKAVDKFKQAKKLADDIEDDLNQIKNDINVVKADFSK